MSISVDALCVCGVCDCVYDCDCDCVCDSDCVHDCDCVCDCDCVKIYVYQSVSMSYLQKSFSFQSHSSEMTQAICIKAFVQRTHNTHTLPRFL